MTRGIVLLALGNAQYGRLAGNIAASIRFADKDIAIHLIYSGESISHLTQEHRDLFTSIAECPAECYTKSGQLVYLKAKTCIYDLSPFGETLFLDVDMLIFGNKPISKLFDVLKDIDFCIQNRGYVDLSIEPFSKINSAWCSSAEVKKVYQTDGRLYAYASELIYFKKTDANKKYFDLVKEVFDAPKITTTVFDGDIPDEVAFQIASAVLKHYPHKDNAVYIFWHGMEKSKSTDDIAAHYYGYSIGGNGMPSVVKAKYETLVKYYSKAIGLPMYFKPQNKRQWNKQRQTR